MNSVVLRRDKDVIDRNDGDLAAVLAAAINAMHVDLIDGLIEAKAISEADGAAITGRIANTLDRIAEHRDLTREQRMGFEKLAEPLHTYARVLSCQ